VWLEGEEALAVPGTDVGPAEGAWPAAQGMDPSYDQTTWGCGAYMVFVPVQIMDPSYLEVTGMSMEMVPTYA